MKKIDKVVTFYVSEDGIEHETEEKCREWDKHLVLKGFHERLFNLGFHIRCKIVPYHFYSEICFIGDGRRSKELSKNNSYVLASGRYSEHGDERVIYKSIGTKIRLLIYNTEEMEYRYQFSIPKKWIELTIDELKIEVEEFLKNRKVFVKEVKTTETITYREV